MIAAVPGCYPKIGAGPQEETALRRVRVLKLSEEPVVDTLSLIGSIEPWQEVVQYFEVTGVVEEVFVEEGATVEAGDQIARLELRDFDLAVSRAEAELGVARAQLDLLLAGTRKEDIEATEADFTQAEVRLAFWNGELQRIRKLYEKDAIALTKLEEVRREHDAAAQQQRATKARWERALAGPRKEEIEAARAEVKAHTEAAALAKRQLEKATLRAPFRGRVERRLVDVGAYINVFPTGGVPVVHLVDLSRVDAVMAVAETFRPRLRGVRRLQVVSAVDPQVRATADVIQLGRVADEATGTYELRARISNPDGRFTGQMVVIATTTAEASRRAIRIPLTALCRAYGQPPYVLLAEPKPGRVAARQVRLGPITADRVEIADGLSAGDLLIVEGHHRVVVGDRVEYELQSPPSQRSGK